MALSRQQLLHYVSIIQYFDFKELSRIFDLHIMLAVLYIFVLVFLMHLNTTETKASTKKGIAFFRERPAELTLHAVRNCVTEPQARMLSCTILVSSSVASHLTKYFIS